MTKKPSKIMLLALFLLLSAAMLAATSMLPQAQAGKKRALIVWGGAMHEPKQCVDIFAPWLTGQGFDVEVSSTLDSYLDAEKKMMSLSLVVQSITAGQITAQQERGLLNAIRAVSEWPAGTVAWGTPSAAIPNTSSWLAASGWLTKATYSSMKSM
jgi:hypothetical protein